MDGLLVLDAHRRAITDELSVLRVLPQVARRHLGPFVFLDHMGPTEAIATPDLDVRPHPHIGLATVTWLFEGRMVHRDSLGSVQVIGPGEINWMTAGRGIVHSERSHPDDHGKPRRLHGLQLWVALPTEHEETEPSFHHHPAAVLPDGVVGGARVRVMVGGGWGLASPVATFSPLFFADARMPAGTALPGPGGYAEVGVYVVSGAIACAGERVEAHRLAVLPSSDARIEATEDAHVVWLGGEPPDGPRHLFWNFVSSHKDRLEAAAQAWRERRFPPIPGDDAEFIPLP